MGALRGAVVGSLSLIVLYDVIQAPTAGITSLATLPARLAHYVVSPDVPLVPNIALGGTVGGSLAAGGTTKVPATKTAAPATPAAPDSTAPTAPDMTSALTALSN